MSHRRLRSWLLVLGVLGLTRQACAEMPIAVRAVAASLGGGEYVSATGVAGVGVGVGLSEYFEVFAEFTQASGTEYPALSSSGTPGAGPPVAVEVYVLEYSRHDRLLVGGGRVSTSRVAPFSVFAEAGGGTIRRTDVLSGTRGLVSETFNRPVVVFGGGVAGRAGHFEAEAGYRTGRFSYGSYSDRVSELRAAAGVRF